MVLALLWSHHCVVIVAQVSQYALIAAWVVVDANALAMSQQPFMEVVDCLRVRWEQGLQQLMGCISSHLFSDEAKPDAHPVYMHINPQTSLGLLKEM